MVMAILSLTLMSCFYINGCDGWNNFWSVSAPDSSPTETVDPTATTVPTNTATSPGSGVENPSDTVNTGCDGTCTPTPSPLPTPTPVSTSTPPNYSWDEDQKREYIESFGFTLLGNWTGAILNNLWETLFTHIGYQDLKFWLNYNLKYNNAVLNIGGIGDNDPNEYSGYTQQSTITFYQNGTVNPEINMLHEIGHLVDNLWNDYFTKQLQKETFTIDDIYEAGWDGEAYQQLDRETVYSKALFARRVGGGSAWQQLEAANAYSYDCWQYCEDWGDIFANAMINNINLDTDLGGQMYLFFNKMENHVKGITP